MKYSMANVAGLIFIGVLAGIINGLIGCGGGIVVVYALSRMTASFSDRHDVFATAVASILPMSAVSSYIYIRAAGGIPDGMAVYLVPAVAGGVAGAFLLDKISGKWLGRIFSLLVIWAGVSLILKGTGVM